MKVLAGLGQATQVGADSLEGRPAPSPNRWQALARRWRAEQPPDHIAGIGLVQKDRRPMRLFGARRLPGPRYTKDEFPIRAPCNSEHHPPAQHR